MNDAQNRLTKFQSQLEAAAARFQSRLETFLQDLVRLRSVNGRQTEAAVAQRIVQEAQKLGLQSRFIAAEPRRSNVLVEWGHGPRGFALVGHMDTVAPGDEAQWTYPPFAATIDGERLVGRGAADNKAGIACGLYTLALLRDEGLLDPEDVRLSLVGVVDEESGASSPLGVRALLDGGHLDARGAIYTYCSDIVCVGHRGLLRLHLRVTGEAVHSGSEAWSRGQGGANAVTGLAAVLLALEKLRVPATPHPAFAHLDFTITPGTLVEGGDYESMVPASAWAMVDARLLPGQAPEAVLETIETLVRETLAQRRGVRATVDVKNSLPAAAISVDHRLAQIAARHAAQFTGRDWLIRGAGPANEGYMLIAAGVPTLCGFGPQGGNVHAPDEWVALPSLSTIVAIYAATIHDYLKED